MTIKIRYLIILSLLPIISSANQVLTLIDELNKFFTFDHNIFLLESSVDRNRFLSLKIGEEQSPQTIYVFQNADKENFAVSESITKISSGNTFVIVALGTSSFRRYFDFFDEIKRIERLQLHMKIAIFFPQSTALDDIRELFEWCKEQLIVNIFAATYGTHLSSDEPEGPTTEQFLNIFTFHPFGTLDVLVPFTFITTCDTYHNFFPSLKSNFQQYPLRVGEPFDYYFDREFWRVVFQLMNASYSIDLKSFANLSEYFQNGIDILLVWYIQKEKRDLYFYPIMMESYQIIVPEAQPYSDFSAYLRVATSEQTFTYLLLTISGVMTFLAVVRYIKYQKILFFDSVVDVLNLLMNDNGYINYQQLSYAEVLVIVPLTFVGFVVVNGILSSLQSYLTRPVLQPQIKTLEDIYNSPFPITAWRNYWKDVLTNELTRRTNYQNWENKTISLDDDQFKEQVHSYNTSISYFGDAGTVDYLLRGQKRLNIKGYYNPQIEIARHFVSYHLSDRFLFFDRINEITDRFRSAGLIEFWYRRGYNEYEYDIIKRNIARLSYSKGKRFQEIKFPMFIVYGWIAGGCVFVAEIILKPVLLMVGR